MSDHQPPVPLAELSRLWALVTFLHPRGQGAAWAEAFDALLDRGAAEASWPGWEAVDTALSVLDDPLTRVLPPGWAEPCATPGPELQAAVPQTVIQAADYVAWDYDLSLGRLLRDRVRDVAPGDMLIDLRGATWWFLRQVGPALSDALGSRLELPAEHARIVSGPTLGAFDQSGAPWGGQVRQDAEVIEPECPAQMRRVTIVVAGHGALAGQLATAAQHAGARVLRADEQDVPYGSAATVRGSQGHMARVRTSWIDEAATTEGPPGTPRTAPASVPAAALLAGIVKLSGYLRYFYPYADERLSAALQQAECEATGLVTEQAFARILGKLQDSHARVYSRDQNQCFGRSLEQSPFVLRDDRAVLLREGGGVLARFAAGTQLLAIDESPVDDRVNGLLAMASHSSEMAAAWLVERYLFRLGAQQKKLLLAKPDGTQEEILLSPAHIRPDAQPPVSALAGNILLVDMTRLEQADVQDAARAAQSASGLIVDLRGYAGAGSWQLARQLAWRQERVAVFERRELRGAGPSVTARARHEAYVSRCRAARRIPVVALIDHRTISRSEYLALLLRAGTNCLWLGATSAGCVGDVAHFQVAAEISLTFSGQKTLTPAGGEIQGTGLTPDIKIDPFPDGNPLPRSAWVAFARSYIDAWEEPDGTAEVY